MTETYHGFIDTARDALLIFEACNAGLLPRVQRRFSDRERQTIRSGAVYVWDEEETGMRRWTDGRTWSPSRVHGCFLIYYELEGRRHQFVSKPGSAGTRGSRGSRSAGQGSSSSRHAPYDPAPPSIMQKEQGLIKKALSLCTNDKRKMHLVCYYSREDVEASCLTSPTNDPMFKGIEVYEDRYPEISYNNGRLDRYGGGRARSSAASKAWSSSSSDGPPAYARSSMLPDRRSQSYRSEVYRYPSYGPYAGPVRHVNVPPVYTQQPQQALTTTNGVVVPAQNGATPPSHSIGPHYSHHQPHLQIRHYGNCGYPPPQQQQHRRHYPSAPPQTGYPNNPHTHPVEANSNIHGPARISPGHSLAESAMTSPVYKHSPPPSPFLPSPPGHSGSYQHQKQSQPPVWQHCEPPRVYMSPDSAQHPEERPQRATQYGRHQWNSSGNRPALHEGGGNNLPGYRQSPPHSMRISESQPPRTGSFTSLASPSSTPYIHASQQQQQQQGSGDDATLVQLPSIEKLGTLPLAIGSKGAEQHLTDELARKQTVPPAITPGNGTSAANMSSEDMRQLASLRLSLHQWG
ncbi:Gluconate transport-inducing protein [Coemansia sp. RSA 2559]|nr:Gluconate transport-inducing protein [Coemansia sp. RSA 2559]